MSSNLFDDDNGSFLVLISAGRCNSSRVCVSAVDTPLWTRSLRTVAEARVAERSAMTSA